MNKMYQNPIAKKGDFADPFVLRYNGRYYLYATNPDIRCFSSDNLVDWKLEGPVITEDVFGDLVPFAPEVVYANGRFYMYTSPSGFGHYVLESDSPLGPFRKITENVGHDIDGTIFIDDDGKWYFYWAGFDGIWGCEMYSPTEFGKPVLTGASLHGWTEGPYVCKQNGIYYMTYTGNHYLSNGYRIQTAWSRNPLSGYQDDPYNPALIHTEGEGVGLGHSSTVVGPDLVSYYLMYHNLNADATRDLNIDRIIWHQEATQILGPTRTAQAAPKLSDFSFPERAGIKTFTWEFLSGSWEKKDGFYYSSEKGVIVSTMETFGDFTAEMNVIIPSQNSNCGITMKGSSGEEYRLKIHAEDQMIGWVKINHGKEQWIEKMKVEHMVFCDVLHTIKLCRENDGLITFIDGRKLIEMPLKDEGIRIGYYAQAGGMAVGYMALTESTYEKEKKCVVIPENCSCMPVCGSGMGSCDKYGGMVLKMGESAEYKFWVDKENDFILYVTQMEDKTGELEVYLDGKSIENRISQTVIGKIKCHLKAGEHAFRLESRTENTGLERLELVEEKSGKGEKEKHNIIVDTYGKEVFHDCEGDDYLLEVKFRIRKKEESGRGGILLRVTEPSEGGEGADQKLGTYFFKGYSVSTDGKKLIVEKHCYDHQSLGEVVFAAEEKKEIHLHISIQDNCIRVFDGGKHLLLEVYDKHPLTQGCVGVWTQGCITEVESLHWSK